MKTNIDQPIVVVCPLKAALKVVLYIKRQILIIKNYRQRLATEILSVYNVSSLLFPFFRLAV